MIRLKLHAATFALVIGLLSTFTQTARAESWSWENLFSFGSSENAAAVCMTDTVVVNGLDSGAGSLRQAVIDACPGGTITFSGTVGGTVLLESGQIVIDKNLTLAGPGADVLTFRNGASPGENSRIFTVYSGVTVVISGLSISGGAVYEATADYYGGGIDNSGNLTLNNVTVSGNSAGKGGGLYF